MIEAMGDRHFSRRANPAPGGEKRVREHPGQLARSLKEDVVEREGLW
jgi:hypothetical protein